VINKETPIKNSTVFRFIIWCFNLAERYKDYRFSRF